MSDPRILIDKDKRLPDSLSGDANKIVAVSADESGYVHSQTVAVTDITGQIIMWPLDAPPSGYLICNGAQYNVNDYPALGALFGSLPGGQFNVPDLTDRFPKASGGVNTNTTEAEEVGPHDHDAEAQPNHNHSLNINSVGNHQHLFYNCTGTGSDAGPAVRRNDLVCSYQTGVSAAGAHGHSGSIGQNGGHDHVINQNTGTKNQPACTRINFCIKT